MGTGVVLSIFRIRRPLKDCEKFVEYRVSTSLDISVAPAAASRLTEHLNVGGKFRR